MPGFEVIGDEERRAVNEVFDDGGILFARGFGGSCCPKGMPRSRCMQAGLADHVWSLYGEIVAAIGYRGRETGRLNLLY